MSIITRHDMIMMIADREIDAFMARHVFDYAVSWWSIHPPEAYNEGMTARTCASDEILLPNKLGDMPVLEVCIEGEWSACPHYSSDIMAAIDALEKRYKYAIERDPNGYTVKTWVNEYSGARYGTAYTLPMAICRSLLMWVDQL